MRTHMVISLAAALALGVVFSVPAHAQDPPPVVDVDLDGVDDAVDECIPSDLSATVVIGSCDSGVANQFFPTGCTLADTVAACAVGAKNHGRYASCVARTTNALKRLHVITGREKGAIQRCAAQSDFGKPPRP